MHLTVTPFEEQLMQTIGHLVDGYAGLTPFAPEVLVSVGRKAFGDGWGGSPIDKNALVRHYPVILRFLGRLQNKGLVARGSDKEAGSWGETWAYWGLTPQGCEFLGIEPTPWTGKG